MSDCDKVRVFIKKNGTITVWQASHILNVNDLRSRVSEMADVARDHFASVVRRDGKRSRIAVYAFI